MPFDYAKIQSERSHRLESAILTNGLNEISTHEVGIDLPSKVHPLTKTDLC